MDLQNIASTFSPASDAILADILEKNRLDDVAGLILTNIAMQFSRQEISEGNMVNGIAGELNISKGLAEQIVKRLTAEVIPTLWDKMPEEERNKLLGVANEPLSLRPKGPAFLSVEDNAKLLQNERGLPKSAKIAVPAPQKVKKSAGQSRLPKKPIVQNQPEQSGPDKYREEV